MPEELFRKILDESSQMVQVSDINTFEMMYANRPATVYTGHADMPYAGEKCYKYMMGLDAQCPFCPMLNMEPGDSSMETEIDNGTQVFKVKTARASYAGHDAFIEYAIDVTLARRAQEIYSSDVSRLLNSIPEAQGIHHVNLTRNTCLSIQSKEMTETPATFDELVDKVAGMLLSAMDAETFRTRFARKNLIQDYKSGKSETSMEVTYISRDGSSSWARVTARNMVNPSSGDMECILYVMDIRNEKNMEELARRDTLTGAFNKAAFRNMVEAALKRPGSTTRAIVFIDIDHFKSINDTFGHLVGDMVITSVAHKLQMVFSDLDIISRFGGDEFCVYLEGITHSKLTEKLDRFRRYIINPNDNSFEKSRVGLTCSIGIAFAGDSAPAYDRMLGIADAALYKAKEAGRNRIIYTDI